MKFQHPRVCMLMIIGFLITLNSAFPVNALATNFNSSNLLQLLKKQDRFYSNGTIIYQKERSLTEVNSLDKKQQHQEMRTKTKKGSPKKVLEKITLKYNDELKFKRQTIALNTPKEMDIITLFDGKNEIVIYGKYITLNINSPVDIRSYMRMIGVYPGACFVYGRGLSALQNIRIERVGANVRLKGSTSEGSNIIALLDPKSDFLAQVIERRDKQGKLVSKMLLGKTTKTKQGKLIASSATYIIYGNGSSKTTTRYKLISADLSKPIDEIFQFSPTNGQTIIDNRMGYPIVWKMALRPGINMSIDTLLSRTKKKLIEIRKTENVNQSMEQNEIYRRLAFIIIPIILLIIIGCWQFYQVRFRSRS